MGERRLSKLMYKKVLPAVICCIVLLGCLIYGIIMFNDYSMLKSCSTYADGPVGIAAQIPYTVFAFNRLKASPFAELIFKELEQNSTVEGKMYALKALKTIDNNYFKSLTEKYTISNEVAKCQYGCIVTNICLGELFESSPSASD